MKCKRRSYRTYLFKKVIAIKIQIYNLKFWNLMRYDQTVHVKKLTNKQY